MDPGGPGGPGGGSYDDEVGILLWVIIQKKVQIMEADMSLKGRHALPKGWKCHILVSYQIYVVLPKIAKNCQKP